MATTETTESTTTSTGVGAASGPSGAGRGDPAGSELLWDAGGARRRRREFGVGLFVLAGAVATLIALFTLTDAATFRGRYIVTLHVADAGGIRRGDPVQMRGVNIGRVRGFELAESEDVAVRLELEREYPVPEGSHVVVRSNGLLGGMVADVIPGTGPQRIRGGAVLEGVRAEGLGESVEGVGRQAEQVLDRASTLLSGETVGAIGDGALAMQALVEELRALSAAEGEALLALTQSLGRTAGELERVTDAEELQQMLRRLDGLVARADETTASLAEASRSLGTVLGRLERGEGTLGRLSTDETLYQNLAQASQSLEALLEDVRANPKRYFSVSVF